MFKRQFTDVYGTSHTMAVFEVNSVNVYASNTANVYLGDQGEVHKEEDANVSADFSARFWVSQEAKNMNHLPMVFSIIDPSDGIEKNIFTLEGVSDPSALTPELLIAEAEKVMINIITQGQE